MRESLKEAAGRVGVWARGKAEALDDRSRLLRIGAAEKRLAMREGDLAVRFTGEAPMGRPYELVIDARALLPALFARVRERISTKRFHGGVWNCPCGVCDLAERCASAPGPELVVTHVEAPDLPMGLPAEAVRSFICPVCGERPGAELRSEPDDAPGQIGSRMGWSIHCAAGHLLVRSGQIGS